MEHAVKKISICIFVCCVFVAHTNGQNDLNFGNMNDQTPDVLVNRTPLACQYNLTFGDHICDCNNRHTLFTLKPLNGNLNNVIIANCKDLSLERETFRHVDFINRIHFENIQRLSLEKYAIAFRSIKPTIKIQLKFSNVNIQQLDSYAIDGCVDTVAFDRCRIRKFTAYAMNTQCSSIYRFSMENTEVAAIDMHAFKKLSIDHLVFKNTAFQSHLPSRVFSALSITKQISITNCSFKTIYSRAFDLDEVNDFIFADNKIEQLDAEAFTLNANGRIIIEQNVFSRIDHLALTGIHVGEKMKKLKMEIQFLSNVIDKTDSPIRFETDSNVHLRILDLKFSQIINCDEAERLKHSAFLPKYAEFVYFRRSGDSEYSSLSSIWTTKCTVTTYITAIALVAAVLVLILIIIIVAIFYRFLGKRQPTRPIPMVIPDGKTYRETQIMMQIEHADLLKTNL